MAIRALLKRHTYYDSITLMSVAQAVKDLPGVEDVGAVMATVLNRELLHNSNLVLATLYIRSEKIGGSVPRISRKSTPTCWLHELSPE